MAQDIHHFEETMTEESAVFWINRCADNSIEWDERVSIMKGLQAFYGSHANLLAKAEELTRTYGKLKEPDPFEEFDEEL